jgi:site-specific DNA-cytosine methylase
MPRTSFGAHRLTISSVKAPLPQPTSVHFRPEGSASQSIKIVPTRRLQSPIYRSYESPSSNRIWVSAITVPFALRVAVTSIHWKNRRLTVHEMCRIQTFPDGLSSECGRTEMERQLGNAVPSLIAEILAREIRRQLLDCPINTSLKLLPSKKDTGSRHSRCKTIVS